MLSINEDPKIKIFSRKLKQIVQSIMNPSGNKSICQLMGMKGSNFEEKTIVIVRDSQNISTINIEDGFACQLVKNIYYSGFKFGSKMHLAEKGCDTIDLYALCWKD